MGVPGCHLAWRLLAAAQGGEPESWAEPLAAYLALTLVVVLAGVVLLLRRVSRLARARLEPAPASGAGHADGPKREAEFVVETFQTVIGELQHKGRELEILTRLERERAERSERFSERVIAQMPTGLVVVDRSGRVTAANQSARDLFPALPRQRVEAIGYERAFAEAPDLVRMVAGCLDRSASFHRREVEMRAEPGGGEVRWLGISVSPIGPPEDGPEAALCLMTDLTEVVELRDRLRLQETMAGLGEMAAGLTHELKNSLATIQGYAQLIAGLAPDHALDPSEALVAEVRQLSQMVTDFLNFARPQDVTLAPVEVSGLVDATLARFADRFEEAGVEPRVEIAPDAAAACVLADETLLGRALFNVVQNALEALETVEPPRRLAISVRRQSPADVTIDVRDTGPGIPPADLAKIFIPFFTTRSRGYGIGLALTQKIVLAHGGRISVENASPGAAFRLALPAGNLSVPKTLE